MSEQPTRCLIVNADIGIHWFPSYEENVPCFCGAMVCHVEDEEDDGALGYEIVRPAPERRDTPAAEGNG